MKQIKFTQILASEKLPSSNDYYFTDKGLLYFYKSDYYTLRGKINFWEDENQNEIIVKFWFKKSLNLESELIEMLEKVSLRMSKKKGEDFALFYEVKTFIQSVKQPK